MNTRQLQYILTLAEERSFTKAAKRLYVAQPSLSIYISKLEQELGHQLFDRSASPLRLTIAGEMYVEMAHRILEMEKQTQKALNDMSHTPHGHLMIAASAHRNRCIVSPHLKAFLDKYPHYNITLQDCSHPQMIKLLETGDADFCVMNMQQNQNKYHMEPLLEEEVLLAVSAGHPINRTVKILNSDGAYPTVDLAQFQDMTFLTVNEGNNLYQLTQDLCWESGFRPQKLVQCSSLDVCRDLTEDGVGVSLLQSSVISYRDYRSGLTCYRLVQAPQKIRIAAVWKKKQYLSIAAQDFIEIIQHSTR